MSSIPGQNESIEFTVSESCLKLINTKNNLKAILAGQKEVIDFFGQLNESPKFNKKFSELDRQVYKFSFEEDRNYIFKTIKEVHDIQLMKDYSAYIYTIGIPDFDEIPYLVPCPEDSATSHSIKVPLEVPLDMMSDFPFGECVMVYGRLNHMGEMQVMIFREIPKAYVKRYFAIVAERNAVMQYL